VAAHPSKVRDAAEIGLARGLERHLPGAVGLVAKGVPLCAIAAFLVLVLGVGIPETAISGLLAYLGLAKAAG
jgi:hypothetical protein